MADQQLDPVAASRADLYRFLSAVLADPPDETAVETLVTSGIAPASELPDAAARSAVERLTWWAEGVTDPQEEADRLAPEHTRLFVGPRPVLQAHESYYSDDFLGEPLARVTGSYAGFEIAPTADLREEADHAAVELAALALLFERGDDGQVVTFLSEHGWWLPELATDIRERASEPFYEAVGELLEELVRADADRLDVRLER